MSNRNFIIVNGINPDSVELFSLRDFISSIKIEQYVKDHSRYTEKELYKLIKLVLTIKDKNQQYRFKIKSLYDEYKSSFQIENKTFSISDIEELFFLDADIDSDNIIRINDFVMKKEQQIVKHRYRDGDVSIIGTLNGNEVIYWHAPEVSLLSDFMDQFIEIYKNGSGLTIDKELKPILEGALIHFLFVRIHPFSDGNGRTSRILHNIKFANCINSILDSNFEYSPINLSNSILRNRSTYVDKINNVYFGLKYDNNDALNKWFDFILDMVDEQINYFYYNYPNLKMFKSSLKFPIEKCKSRK